MGLTIKHRKDIYTEAGGSFCPIAICDICGENILGIEKANVEFDAKCLSGFEVVHKKCSFKSLKVDQNNWMPLEDFLKNLTHNINTPEKVEAK